VLLHSLGLFKNSFAQSLDSSKMISTAGGLEAVDACSKQVAEVNALLLQQQETALQTKEQVDAQISKETADAAKAIADTEAEIRATAAAEKTRQLELKETAYNAHVAKQQMEAVAAQATAVSTATTNVATARSAALSTYEQEEAQRIADAVAAKILAAPAKPVPPGLVNVDIDRNGVVNTQDAVTLFVAETMQGYGATKLIDNFWKLHGDQALAPKVEISTILWEVRTAKDKLRDAQQVVS